MADVDAVRAQRLHNLAVPVLLQEGGEGEAQCVDGSERESHPAAKRVNLVLRQNVSRGATADNRRSGSLRLWGGLELFDRLLLPRTKLGRLTGDSFGVDHTLQPIARVVLEKLGETLFAIDLAVPAKSLAHGCSAFSHVVAKVRHDEVADPPHTSPGAVVVRPANGRKVHKLWLPPTVTGTAATSTASPSGAWASTGAATSVDVDSTVEPTAVVVPLLWRPATPVSSSVLSSVSR